MNRLNQTVDKIYCINLDRRPDRWAQAKEQFDKHGLTVERFAAIDGKDFKRQYPSSPAICGCTLSHYFLIERAKLLGFKAIMIFEDDVVLHDDFNQRLLETFVVGSNDWSMLLFGGAHREKPHEVSGFSPLMLRINRTLTTHAYIIRESMYDLVINNFKNLEQPVDCHYASWQKEFPVYITNPPLAWQREGYSDIENRNMNYDWIKTNQQ